MLSITYDDLMSWRANPVTKQILEVGKNNIEEIKNANLGFDSIESVALAVKYNAGLIEGISSVEEYFNYLISQHKKPEELNPEDDVNNVDILKNRRRWRSE